MQIESIQVCEEIGEYTPIEVDSFSDPDRVYTVLVINVDEPSDNICECEGFKFRGHCNHQIVASELVCMWIEGDPEQQTKEQHRKRICPRCGGPTFYSMELVDDN